MAKKRLAIPKRLEKQAFQEAGSKCSFCPEADVAALQVHHVDGDPVNNVLANLLVACASCHSKITAGVLSEGMVRSRKSELAAGAALKPAAVSAPAVHVTIANSTFKGDIAQNITKISTRGTPRIMHPPGSLGADLTKKGYVDYLISQYFDFRKADASYGVRRPFNHSEIHTTIQRTFGHKTFFMPVGLFDRLVQFLQGRIDDTVLGRNNRSRGRPNFHSFEAHHPEQKHPLAPTELGESSSRQQVSPPSF